MSTEQPSTKIDTINDCLIGQLPTGEIVPLLPLILTTREQAYRAAAWIVVLAARGRLPAESNTSFEQVLEAVCRT